MKHQKESPQAPAAASKRAYQLGASSSHRSSDDDAGRREERNQDKKKGSECILCSSFFPREIVCSSLNNNYTHAIRLTRLMVQRIRKK